MIKMILLM